MRKSPDPCSLIKTEKEKDLLQKIHFSTISAILIIIVD